MSDFLAVADLICSILASIVAILWLIDFVKADRKGDTHEMTKAGIWVILMAIIGFN